MVGFSLVRTVPVLFTLVSALALGCGSEPEPEIRGPGGDGGTAGSGGTGGSGGAAGTGGGSGDGGGGSGGSGTGGTGGDGGFCISNSDCTANEFCADKYECRGLGVCRSRPQSCGGAGGTGGTGGTGGCPGIVCSNCGGSGDCDIDCQPPQVEVCRAHFDNPGLRCAFCADPDFGTGGTGGTGGAGGTEIRDVCGCDGSTYDSKCHAEMAGVTLVSEDLCAGACCHDSSECEAGGCVDFYGGCDTPSVCSDCSGSAPTCDEPIPVCGCDGVTYECPDPPRYSVGISAVGPCTCENNADCLPTEYCHAADCTGPGNCLPRATCVSTSPAAGCDGVIYSNACEAAEAGVRVERKVDCRYSFSPYVYTDCRESIHVPSTF